MTQFVSNSLKQVWSVPSTTSIGHYADVDVGASLAWKVAIVNLGRVITKTIASSAGNKVSQFRRCCAYKDPKWVVAKTWEVSIFEKCFHLGLSQLTKLTGYGGGVVVLDHGNGI